jgi:hypothetical protein
VCDSICSSARAQTLTANSKADVWSVGVLLLLLLRNELPFTESDPTFFIEQVLEATTNLDLAWDCHDCRLAVGYFTLPVLSYFLCF